MTAFYDNPITTSHTITTVDTGTPIADTKIYMPSGKTHCRIVEVAFRVTTETTVCTSTDAQINLGIAADPDEFASLDIGNALATPVTVSSTQQTDVFIGTDNGTSSGPYWTGSPDVVNLGAQGYNVGYIEVVALAGAGGTVAGIGDVSLTLQWW